MRRCDDQALPGRSEKKIGVKTAKMPFSELPKLGFGSFDSQ
jgi:hypothetical protein